jgi:4-amino-4-deoxy-L-arabinose transferase and related glycosyltransferases of PMT family
MDSGTEPAVLTAPVTLVASAPWRTRVLTALVPILVAGGFAATVVGSLYLSNRDFWHVDDAVNEFGPYVGEIGRMLSHGEWPTLTARSFVGGNQLIDFNRSPLHPLTWVAAGLLHFLGFHRGAIVFAAVLVALAFLGGYVLGRALAIKPILSYLMAASYATAPMFLYIYAADWWNGALSTVCFVWAGAALARAMRHPDGRSAVLLGLGVAMVFLAGWPHGDLALVLVGAMALAIGLFGPSPLVGPGRRLRWAASLLIPAVLGALIALPAYAEYFAASGYLARANGLDNADNFLVPSVWQILSVADPLGGDFWSVFGGYRYWDIPIGFVTLAAYLAVFFVRVDRKVLRSAPVLIAAAAAIALLLATQTPSQLGPTRWPFRFLPLAGLAVLTVVTLVIDRGRLVMTRFRLGAAILTLGAVTLVSAWRIEQPTHDSLRAIWLPVVLFCLVSLVLIGLSRRQRLPEAAAVLTVIGIVMMLVGAPSAGLGGRYVQAANLPTKTQLAKVASAAGDGMILVTELGLGFSPATTVGTRALLGGTAVFNGYDPVSYIAYDRTFHPLTAHGLVDESVLDYLTAARPDWGECGLVAAGITAVATSSDPVTGRHAALARCGFVKLSDNHRGAALFSRKSTVQAGGPTIALGGASFDSVQTRDQEVTVKVRSGNSPATLIFSRLAWPGYSAELDGRPLEVSSVEGYLLSVDLPASADGELRLSYQPISWPVAPLIALAALAALITVAAVFGGRRTRTSAAGSRSG